MNSKLSEQKTEKHEIRMLKLVYVFTFQRFFLNFLNVFEKYRNSI